MAENSNALDRYEVIDVARSELKNAPYNPRRPLTDSERRKLRAGIERHGFLAPPTWNKRTGNIVGGHQRIAVRDAIEGTHDYRLKVAAVDLDDQQEREANLLLNNANAQGDFDLEKLEAMLNITDMTVPSLDLSGTGFDCADMIRLFGDSLTTVRTEDISALAVKLREFRDHVSKGREKTMSRFGVNFYTVLVFENESARDKAHIAMGLDSNRYQDGRVVARRLASGSSSGESTE